MIPGKVLESTLGVYPQCFLGPVPFILQSPTPQLISLEFKISWSRGTWGGGAGRGAQSVEHPASVQVMISQFAVLSPASGSVLTA